MSGFEDPVCVAGVGDRVVVPDDLQVAGDLLEERGPREVLDVELRLGWHLEVL